jgi:hypothetical protein
MQNFIRLNASNEARIKASFICGLLLTLLLFSGCAAKQANGRSTIPQMKSATVAVVGMQDCCGDKSAPLYNALMAELRSRKNIKLVEIAEKKAPHQKFGLKRKVLRKALQTAELQYVAMQMEQVKSTLLAALQIAETQMVGFRPQELARTHLLLGAANRALQKESLAKQHLTAALRYNPKIRLDAESFAQPIRDMAETIRKSQKTGALTIHSDPPGARVFVDGIDQGNAPATLTKIPHGGHLVRLERSLHEPLVKRIVVDKAPRITLKLKALDATSVVAETRLNPAARSELPKALGVDVVFWLQEHPNGIRVEWFSPNAATRGDTLTLDKRNAKAASAVAIEQATTLPGTTVARSAWDWKRPSLWLWVAAGLGVLTAVVYPFASASTGSQAGNRDAVLTIP